MFGAFAVVAVGLMREWLESALNNTRAELQRRRDAEEELARHRDHLEELVEQRTEELLKAQARHDG